MPHSRHLYTTYSINAAYTPGCLFSRPESPKFVVTLDAVSDMNKLLPNYQNLVEAEVDEIDLIDRQNDLPSEVSVLLNIFLHFNFITPLILCLSVLWTFNHTLPPLFFNATFLSTSYELAADMSTSSVCLSVINSAHVQLQLKIEY